MLENSDTIGAIRPKPLLATYTTNDYHLERMVFCFSFEFSCFC